MRVNTSKKSTLTKERGIQQEGIMSWKFSFSAKKHAQAKQNSRVGVVVWLFRVLSVKSDSFSAEIMSDDRQLVQLKPQTDVKISQLNHQQERS